MDMHEQPLRSMLRLWRSWHQTSAALTVSRAREQVSESGPTGLDAVEHNHGGGGGGGGGDGGGRRACQCVSVREQ